MATAQCSYRTTGVCSGPGCPLGVPFIDENDKPMDEKRIICSWQKKVVKAFFADKEAENDEDQS